MATHCYDFGKIVPLFALEGECVCVIDLDTTMPGFVLSDFGDFIRTAANTGAEDDKDFGRVGLGPACQLLDIHRGNRMTYLVAMDSKALTGPKLTPKYSGHESPDFQNADHTMTMIQTGNGQTIHLQHDVMNPRPYSRMYQLVGTEGYASKYPVSGYTFRSAEKIDGVPDFTRGAWKKLSGYHHYMSGE